MLKVFRTIQRTLTTSTTTTTTTATTPTATKTPTKDEHHEQVAKGVSYNPYEEFLTPSPYQSPSRGHRHGFKPTYYQGGPLPRSHKFHGKPIRALKKRYAKITKSNAWTEEKATFGQNDYIDILGDGSVHPVDLYDAPFWLRGWKGNWFEHLVRRRNYQGRWLSAHMPDRLHDLEKEIFYHFKRLNLRRRKRMPGE